MMDLIMLSKTEARAMKALFDYGSIRMAGNLLGIPYETIRKQLYAVRKKLGVKSNLQLVALAHKSGWI